MVTGVGATMPTGGVTVGATPPAQHVPQEAGQPPAQTTTTTTTTRRSGENRRVSVFERNLTEEYMFNLLPLKRMGSKVRSKSRRVSSIFFEILSDRDRLDVKINIYIYSRCSSENWFQRVQKVSRNRVVDEIYYTRLASSMFYCPSLFHAEEMATKYSDNFATLPKHRVSTLEIETSLNYFRHICVFWPYRFCFCCRVINRLWKSGDEPALTTA